MKNTILILALMLAGCATTEIPKLVYDECPASITAKLPELTPPPENVSEDVFAWILGSLKPYKNTIETRITSSQSWCDKRKEKH